MAQEPNNSDMAENAGQGDPSGDTPRPPSKVNAKVELDLEDAPFLEEEDEPEPAPKAAPVPESKPVAAAPAGPSLKDRLLANKKKLILAGGGGLVLIILAIVLNILFSGEEPAPAPPAPESVSALPKPLPEAPTPQFLMEWEPFWVELKDTEGAIRFLTCKFSVPTDNPILFSEMNGKKLILRDALFYYLRNQPIISLTDDTRAQSFKGDLLTVMNEHLGSGKVSEILIEDYLVQ